MRYLAWHVDYFMCRVTERGRSPLAEEFEDPVTTAEEALLVLVSVEREDEAAPAAVARKAVAELETHAAQLGVTKVVLHPFAHLFGQLSRPVVAVQVLGMVAEGLMAAGIAVNRTPFGWFNTMEIRAKGHPLSRVARIIVAGEQGE